MDGKKIVCKWLQEALLRGPGLGLEKETELSSSSLHWPVGQRPVEDAADVPKGRAAFKGS